MEDGLDIIIDKAHDGMLLRDYIKGVLGISHSLLSSLKSQSDGIMLNGSHVTVRAVLHVGDLLSVKTDDSTSSDIEPVGMPLDIIYEDDGILAVSKPPSMPTHPSIKHRTDTLANAVMFYLGKTNENAVFRAITRLDKDTSGVVLLAKNAYTAAILTGMMQEGRISKQYVAIVRGTPPEHFTVEKNIKRVAESIITREVCSADEGRYARTEFIRLSSGGELSLVRAIPYTGRTHQIRVHLASEGFPIVGDSLYGDNCSLISRHALHAERLILNFPDGRILTLTSPIPEDMSLLADQYVNT